MAPRWKLLTQHYLRVEGSEWEYKEIDRGTGKQIRKSFPVPRLIDPNDPSDWTQRTAQGEGEVIVTNVKDGDYATDIYFMGEPGPDMMPINSEAQEITNLLAKTKWKHPIENANGSYSQSLLDDLQRQVAEVAASNSKPAEPAPIQGMQELLTAMAGMMKQNRELITALAKGADGRRL